MIRGIGHEFEKVYTTSQISGSTRHHRILSYRFSDLNFIVRYETDGYVPGTTLPSFHSKDPESDRSIDTFSESIARLTRSILPCSQSTSVLQHSGVLVSIHNQPPS